MITLVALGWAKLNTYGAYPLTLQSGLKQADYHNPGAFGIMGSGAIGCAEPIRIAETIILAIFVC